MRQTRKERLKPSDTGLHAIHGEKAGAKTGFWQKGSSGCLWNRSQFQCRTRGDLSAESNRSIDESIGQHEGHPVSSKRMYHTVRFVFEPEHSDEGESSVLRFDVLCRKGLSLQRVSKMFSVRRISVLTERSLAQPNAKRWNTQPIHE